VSPASAAGLELETGARVEASAAFRCA